LYASAWGGDASRASSATAAKSRNVGSGQCICARPFATVCGLSLYRDATASGRPERFGAGYIDRLRRVPLRDADSFLCATSAQRGPPQTGRTNVR
jgi:hypothetical protein